MKVQMSRGARFHSRHKIILSVLILAAAISFVAVSTVNASFVSKSSGNSSKSLPLFGTLDTQASGIKAQKKAGISVAMFELNWASFEPQQRKFSNAYISTMRQTLEQFRSAGMRVTLGLGLQNPPPWVFSLANSSYVNQFGTVTHQADFVFSEAVRQAASVYLQQVFSDLPSSDFWSIRITSGGNAEMLYPANGSYWAFNISALTGVGLPPSMTANPFPRWRPGEPGLSPSQISEWVSWYVEGLDNVTAWQMQTLTSLGFSGYFQLVTPGSGTRPDVLRAEEKANLPNGVTGVGAVWDRYYAMLPDKSKVVAYVSSVADESGNDDSCQAADTSLALTSSSMDSWSATRWISRIATANHLLVAGENPGFGLPASLNHHYKDRSSRGMMADAIRQATSCKFQAFYWAHDKDLVNGIVPFSIYRRDIASATHSQAPG